MSVYKNQILLNFEIFIRISLLVLFAIEVWLLYVIFIRLSDMEGWAWPIFNLVLLNFICPASLVFVILRLIIKKLLLKCKKINLEDLFVSLVLNALIFICVVVFKLV